MSSVQMTHFTYVLVDSTGRIFCAENGSKRSCDSDHLVAVLTCTQLIQNFSDGYNLFTNTALSLFITIIRVYEKGIYPPVQILG